MTLVIAARCKDGCVVVSDKRQHIISNGGKYHEDGYEKVRIAGPFVVYNHGYNRIDDQDWKLKLDELTPDLNNPIYKKIQQEMGSKHNKKAFYVFLNKKVFHEISIDADGSITLETEKNNELHKSGKGSVYVDFSTLKDIKKKKMEKVKNEMKRIFSEAHDRLKKDNGDEFSKECEVKCFGG